MTTGSAGINVTNDHDDEFVVPHMDISCLQNSFAYQRVLEEPWTYIHNWDSLSVSMQQAVMQSFMQELQEIKTGIAYTEGVYVGDMTGENPEFLAQTPVLPTEPFRPVSQSQQQNLQR
ncbi:unnamed protein product [Schistocephalus solidus]|uniref:Uncharacterized protein n=1 Tax=Schistocephalus solidus TaxID=70667 RepID=A0A0X3PMV7_SCHSO|nr:unnamed protein product [Schistocephalus solidus]